jgi:hypothetical protein
MFSVPAHERARCRAPLRPGPGNTASRPGLFTHVTLRDECAIVKCVPELDLVHDFIERILDDAFGARRFQSGD